MELKNAFARSAPRNAPYMERKISSIINISTDHNTIRLNILISTTLMKVTEIMNYFPIFRVRSEPAPSLEAVSQLSLQ
jgi:hypothetical protein